MEMLRTVVEQNSTRAAVIEGETILTYAELEKQIICLFAQLYYLGIRRGDRVALSVPNGLDFITSYFAPVRLGATIVPLNDQYQQTELLYFFQQSHVSMVITSQPLAALCHEVLRSYESPCQLFVVEDRNKTSKPDLRG